MYHRKVNVQSDLKKCQEERLKRSYNYGKTRDDGD